MMAAERGAARNTLAAYAADLADFAGFAQGRGVAPAFGDAGLLQSYMASLGALAPRSAARRLSALRQFSIATTEIYTHVLSEHLRVLVETHHPLAKR